jgi:hypothetical protein
MLVNCRDAAELEFKTSFASRLREEMDCAVIMVTETPPERASGALRRFADVLFVRKPFYVPVFFQELFQLVGSKSDKQWSGAASNDVSIIQRVTV